MKALKLLFLLLTPFFALGQFSDDFSDGNFTHNPTWVGDTDKFIVENQNLRLNDNAAGQSYLATQSTVCLDTQWDFWVRIAFTPSDNNYPRIYLVSDQQDLTESLNGYFIQIGKTGTDNKRIYLYRQDGTTTTQLIEGVQNLATTTNNLIRVRVVRDQDGNWEVLADGAGGVFFTPQGTATDLTHTATSWFGVVCTYTVTNANRFYFDDFVVGDIIVDTTPPSVLAVEVVNSTTLNIVFDEPVDTQLAQNTSNYTVDRGIGNPVSATQLPTTPHVATLVFGQEFEENVIYQIEVKNIEDLAGNVMEDYTGTFVNYVVQRFSVVFNELMVRPSPVVGLPPHEYIELYNTTEFPINLTGWIFQHGNTRRTIPGGIIEPFGYVLLSTVGAAPSLQQYGNVIGVPGLSATALTDGGTSLLLLSEDERLISFVNYTDEWYRNPTKSNGGWSLELIDPLNFCGGSDNWVASNDPRGGTPGEQNSVKANNPDTTPPELVRIGFENDITITLHFSESIDTGTLLDLAGQNLGAGIVTTVVPMLPDYKRALITLATPLAANQTYEVTLPATLTDCAGNAISRRTARVAIPQKAEPFDVVINEVLFNPPDGGSRYVEIYNRSTKVIELRDHTISSKDTITGFLTNVREISGESFLLFPGDYVVLTASPSAVQKTYMTNNPFGFIQLATAPSMTNTSGILVFANKSLEEIDMFAYHENMHFALLTSTKGVSLERINYHRPTQDRSNWHSAAQGSGFGTPGFKNSQYSSLTIPVVGEIEVYPEVFSPDGDGVDDFLTISYKLENPGYVATVRVFDSRGRLIKNLVKAELLGMEGAFTWDGTTDNNLKAPIGIYLVMVEITGIDGTVSRHRKTAVLGGRF